MKTEAELKRLPLLPIVICLLLLSACGERPVEGDKHPNVPTFPEHSNSKINIQPFAHLTATGSVGSYYYGVGQDLQGEQREDEGREDKGETLFLFDKQFNLINKTLADNIELSPIASHFYQIIRHERIYDDNIRHIFQISLPSFKRTKISYVNVDKEIFKLNTFAIEKKYQKQINEASKSPDFNHRTFINSLSNNESLIYEGKQKAKIDALLNGLICAKELDTFTYVMRYADKEKIVRMVALSRALRNKTCADSEEIPEVKAKFFDKTVMGNSWSGISFLGKYTPYGFDYTNLTLDGETTQTKVKNKGDKPGLSVVFESLKKLMLKTSSEDYFIVTKAQ